MKETLARRTNSVVVLLFTALLLLAGCRSRLPNSTVSSAETQSCSALSLVPEDLFKGAKPGVAVIRSDSMEGSAFVIRHASDSTYLITNAHVVAGSSSVRIKWSDGRETPGLVIANAGGKTPQSDLALIRAQGVIGRALMLKDSLPSVGADVVAIGSPQGLDFSLTRGVVSSLRDNDQLLQIDAPINPGNSGGPILDKSGCVVGVATFKLDDSEGLNFAVSSSVVESFVRSSLSSPAQSAQQTVPGHSVVPSPFTSAQTPARQRSAPGLSTGANCWFQTAPGSQQLAGASCQIRAGLLGMGRKEYELIDPAGVKRVIYLSPNQSVDVYMGGQRFNGKWVEDSDGDVHVHIGTDTFAFTPS